MFPLGCKHYRCFAVPNFLQSKGDDVPAEKAYTDYCFYYQIH
jgi:hypothetical protein